jgi:MFS transporter, VNT family, synaptic vesicle glycoprotein 2
LLLNRKFSLPIPWLNIDYKPWRAYLLACGLPSLVCGIALMFFPESPKFLFSKVSEEEIGELLLKNLF